MELTLTFHCSYCEEELGTELKNGAVHHDDFHNCVGERVGFVADVGGEKIITATDVYVKVED